MSDDNNAPNIWVTALIAVPIVFLLLYFLAPVLLAWPIFLIAGPDKGYEIVNIVFAPVIYLIENVDFYQNYINWQDNLIP